MRSPEAQHTTGQPRSPLVPERLFSCEDQVAIVTGGGSGIGRACAEALAAAGARVAIIGLPSSQPHQAAADLEALGMTALGIVADVSDEKQLAVAVDEVRARWGRIDTVLANAGAALDGTFTGNNHLEGEDIPVATRSPRLAELDAMYALHVRAVSHLAELTLPILARGGGGSFTIMSSLSGVRGNQFIAGYGVTKAANAQIARNLAVQWGPRGIRANAISPGVIDTDFARPITADTDAAAARRAKTPLRRFGTPTEVAGAVVWLSSAAGAFISGQNIIIDGGTLVAD